MTPRVVITGAGAISALGHTARATWEGLVAGRTGIGPLTLFDASRDRTHTAAQIRDFDPARIGPAPGRPRTSAESLGTPKEIARASRGDLIGLHAAMQAVEDAGLDLARHDPTRLGILLGGGAGALLQAEDYLQAALGGSASRPSRVLGFFPSTTADRIARRLGVQGETNTILTACSSATIAIGLAASRVASGELDIVFTGGVEALSRTTYSGFNSLRLVDPGACRPFDRDRRGMSLGECAVVMVLERLDDARRRGAPVYAEVAGYGIAADGHHMTAPEPEGDGIVRSMRAALRSAGLAPDYVDHINAHGTGTEQNDRAETVAIKRVLGERARRVPVVSIKGMVGHCLGAAGAIEAFAAAMTLREGVLPPTAGLRTPDPECDLDFVPGAARRAHLRVALSNSLAFGGNNGTLVLKRVDA
jgi:3-oxoacyl-[acyl-carrier-protein] synthase II